MNLVNLSKLCNLILSYHAWNVKDFGHLEPKFTQRAVLISALQKAGVGSNIAYGEREQQHNPAQRQAGDGQPFVTKARQQ